MTPRALRQRQVGSLSRPVNVQIGFKGTHRRASCTHGTGWSMASGPENHTPISPSVSPAKAHRRSRTHRAPRLRSRKLRLAADVLWRADVPAAAGVSVRAARWLMASTQAVGARGGERRQVGTDKPLRAAPDCPLRPENLHLTDKRPAHEEVCPFEHAARRHCTRAPPDWRCGRRTPID